MKRIFFACLLLGGCNEAGPPTGVGRDEPPPPRPDRPATRIGAGADGDPARAPAKWRERSGSGRREAPLASPVPGRPHHVISPYSGKEVDVSGFAGETEVVDPSFDNPRQKTFRLPSHPVAKAVPGKPGFVFSPFNNQIVDVKGIPAGTMVADPAFPPTEKKYFRVP